MTRFTLAFFFLFVGRITSAADKLNFIELSKSQHVAYDAMIFDPNKTTLILLPGIFRGLQHEDIFIQKLIAKKMNFVSIHFSTQPASVATYSNSSIINFNGASRFLSQVFAQEVEAVVAALQVRHPLAVSLSYSASISQYLNPKIFNLVIETSPIGRFDESEPESAEMFRYWKSFLKWFPVWGEIVAENLKNQAYRNYWARVAQKYGSDDPRLSNPVAMSNLTEGYIAMAKAVETFDLRKQKFANTPYRIFVFGSEQESARRVFQAEALAEYQRVVNPKAQAIVVPGATHVIPNTQPDFYFLVLETIIKKLSSK